MTSPALEVTTHLEVARVESRTAPFKPPRYSFDSADPRDALGIAALGAHYAIDVVQRSLAKGDDEWITARRGQDIVAAVRIRAEEQQVVHTVEAPFVAARHLHYGLERYLTHLAELWIQSFAQPVRA